MPLGGPKTIDDLIQLCKAREIELVIESASLDGTLVLLAQFEGYGQYARIICHGVEFIEWAATVPVRGLSECPISATQARSRWAGLSEKYSGRALVAWSDEVETFVDASAFEVFIIVAERFEYL
jgi:hypothetical protein